jgi:putative redox protein
MSIEVTFRTIPGTQAVESDGEHRVVVDRPEGVAGGMGLGSSGGRLLAMAIGGCLSNDVRYVAQDWGVSIDDVEVDVSLEIEDGLVTSAAVGIRLEAPADVDTDALVDRAIEISTVLAAVRTGFPVEVQPAAG